MPRLAWGQHQARARPVPRQCARACCAKVSRARRAQARSARSAQARRARRRALYPGTVLMEVNDKI